MSIRIVMRVKQIKKIKTADLCTVYPYRVAAYCCVLLNVLLPCCFPLLACPLGAKEQRVVAGVDRASIPLLMMMDGSIAASRDRVEKWSNAGGDKEIAE